MNQFNKDLANVLLSHGDIKQIFRQQLEDTLNSLLQTELSVILGYNPYDRAGFNSGNSRNGQYVRQIDSEFGKLSIEVPRDRNGEFKTITIPPYARRVDTLEETIIKLYEKGITTREIADLIEKMYGAHYSATTVSNITSIINDQVTAFHDRQFNCADYVCLFLDATYVPLRRNSVKREAIYFALGIKANGEKEILDYCIAPSENQTVWTELLTGLVHRGIQNVKLIIADGVVGMDGIIQQSYPQTKFQRCLVHVERNISGKVRVRDRAEILNDFKQVHMQASKAEALQVLHNFIEKWQKPYPTLTKSLATTDNLLTFYEFPPSIRTSIYSTNLIEAFHKQLKRKLKPKEQFPNEAALDRFVVTQVLEYNDRRYGKSHRGFKQCQDTLESMF